jgi:c(7)-type cytochrome triheme protein
MNSHCLRIEFAFMFIFVALAQWSSGSANKDGGFVIYPGAQAGPVVFSHSAHGKVNAGYTCDTCHPSGPQKTVTMENIRNGKDCGSCHDGQTKGTNGRPAPDAKDCGACHMPASDISFKLNRMDPVRFSHVKHLSADAGKKTRNLIGISCGDCHSALFDRASKGTFGMEVPHETGGCAQCHDGRKHNGHTVFSARTRCLACHRGG